MHTALAVQHMALNRNLGNFNKFGKVMWNVCNKVLHICNLWILLRKLVIPVYLVGQKCYLHWTFAVKVNESDVNSGICAIVKTRCYKHTEKYISLIDSEPNRYYSVKINRNSQIHGLFVYFTSVNFNSEKVLEDKIFSR